MGMKSERKKTKLVAVDLMSFSLPEIQREGGRGRGRGGRGGRGNHEGGGRGGRGAQQLTPAYTATQFPALGTAVK